MIGARYKMLSRVDAQDASEVWMAERRRDRAVVLILARPRAAAGAVGALAAIAGGEGDAVSLPDHTGADASVDATTGGTGAAPQGAPAFAPNGAFIGASIRPLGPPREDVASLVAVKHAWLQGRFVCEAFAPGPFQPLRRALEFGRWPAPEAAFAMVARVARLLGSLHARGRSPDGFGLDDIYANASATKLYLHRSARRAVGADRCVDPRRVAADLSSLGALLFWLVTRRTFEPEADLDFIRRGFNVALLLAPSITPAGDAAVARLLLSGHTRGYASAQAALAALQAVAAHLAALAAAAQQEQPVAQPGACAGAPATDAATSIVKAHDAALVHRQVTEWVARKTHAQMMARRRTGVASMAREVDCLARPRAVLASLAASMGYVQIRLACLAAGLLAALVMVSLVCPGKATAHAVPPSSTRGASTSRVLAQALRDTVGRPTSGVNVLQRLHLLRRVRRACPQMLEECAVAPGEIDALGDTLARTPEDAFVSMDRILFRLGTRTAPVAQAAGASASPREG